MSFKKMLSLCSVFITICVTASPAFAAWNNLTQTQKRQAIVYTANYNADLSCGPGGTDGSCTGLIGGYCYPFVNDQVRVAISQAGTPMASTFMNDTTTVIPSQNSQGSGWVTPYQYLAVQSFGAATPSTFIPGQIVQEYIYSKQSGTGGVYEPHTMIITANDTANQILTVVDSNWVRSMTIGRHSMTYAQFMAYVSWTGNAYTLYDIGNSSIPTQ